MSSPGGTGIETPNEEREVYGRIAARPEHRKKGIGKALVAAALAALKKERITKVALVVFSTNESGNAFWNNIGFEMRNDLIYRNIGLDEKNT